MAAEGAESNIRASTLDELILLPETKNVNTFHQLHDVFVEETMRPAKLPLERTELLVLSYEVHQKENYLKQEHE